ncbi:MAG TPA: hydrogenase maturation nickel metallochaperone HypA [Verrucomicrobiae bacterium]|nr:hydrogenase maturation nickel metallochaperone HypA [Verrucomicrobiae bacterium]
MHELSIAEELVRVIREELRAHRGTRLKTAHLRLGALRLVEPTTLEFCFQAAIRDTPLMGAELGIESVEAVARCRQCRREFGVEEKWFECPQCGSSDAELLRGDELQLTSLDIEPEAVQACRMPPESAASAPADNLSKCA